MDPPTAAAAKRPWEDLQAELLCCVGDGVQDLKCYASTRGAYTAWRRAFKPPSPLLLIGKEDGAAAAASLPASLPAHRSFDLRAIPGRCFGCNDRWVAYLSDCWPWPGLCAFSLFNPMTGVDIPLPPLRCESRLVSKVVFAPSPAKDDFTAAPICGNRLGYVVAGDKEWTILDPLRLHEEGDHLTDILFHGKGIVYCLTSCGDVRVLRLPERRTAPAATLEPLFSTTNLPFDPATSFTPFHSELSDFARVKHIVFYQGSLYQIWRNAYCSVNLGLPSGGHRRVDKNEIFVLRYYPQRQPCWDAVTDLGGYSVFVGKNNAVSIYAQGVPGIKGNCVYWIDGFGWDHGMVFDMGTGTSTPCLPLATGPPQRSSCWYIF